MSNAWFQLFCAGLLEVGWAVGLKYSDGLNLRTKLPITLLTLAMLVGSFWLLSLAVRTIPLGTGYAIWTGIGALGAAAVGILFLHEPASVPRLICLGLLVAGIVGLKLTSTAAGQTTKEAAMTLYVGTYTSGESRGLYRVALDDAGQPSEPTLVAGMTNPSFFVEHPTKPIVYVISEVSDFGPDKSGAVITFAVQFDGMFRELNRVSSGGPGPAYVSVSQDGRAVFLANYGGGSVAMLPTNDDGSLRPPSAVVQHHGSGPIRGRQDRAYAHAMHPFPSGPFVLACDLGIDELITYRYDVDRGTLEPIATTKTEPGDGPRHARFSADGRRLYVLNELANTVAVYRVADGRFGREQVVSTLPTTRPEQNTAAEVLIHPSGRWLYATNRGDDSLVTYAIASDGRLDVVDHVKTNGATPRSFAIDPGGRFIVVANQESGTLDVFSIDLTSGKVRATGGRALLDRPNFVRFAR